MLGVKNIIILSLIPKPSCVLAHKEGLVILIDYLGTLGNENGQPIKSLYSACDTNIIVGFQAHI